MKVAELIEKLEAIPKDTVVMIHNCYDDMLVEFNNIDVMEYGKQTIVFLDDSKKVIVGYCMTCHKIRRPDGTWGVPVMSLDNYTLSHGYCEPCGDKAILEARAEMERLKHKKMQWSVPEIEVRNDT